MSIRYRVKRRDETEEKVKKLRKKLEDLEDTIKSLINNCPELEEELSPYLSELSEARKLLEEVDWLVESEKERVLEWIRKKLAEIDKALGEYRGRL